ncbi:DUF2460 domain-containing protein [Acinetobacter terrae]|uniref:DUF2460 domain-containing protein n=1 Tax=Acinetobacter terrae TaxID=2731247 RepID=A0ABX1V710_9GAMM|nr:DUF2460 domain-containing protein [Acinetobacter terrae]NNH88179.1 hypothetical protein [Acinetobacter terrae]
MSDVLFPDLIIGYDLKRKPMFSTKIMTSVNGRELRASYQAVPKYEFSLSLPGLQERKGELQEIEDFFIARRGAFDSFLFKMPFDNEYSCTFVGDGAATNFQLYKGSGVKTPVSHTQAISAISANPYMWNQNDSKLMWDKPDETLMWNMGTVQISKSGQLILSKPLEAGIKIDVKGTYYYRCRFADDDQSFTLFSYRLWKGDVTLIGSLGNKV